MNLEATVLKQIFLAGFLGVGLAIAPAIAGPADRVPGSAGSLVTTADLVKQLKGPRKPTLIHVGFPTLFQGGHIPGSLHADEAVSPQGQALLRKALKQAPKDRDVVLYCGCCPWQDCPNVQPAFKVASQAIGKRAKLLVIPQNFDQDWAAKGYPVER